MTIEEFIEKCQKRPLPSNPIARVKILARELAEGASYELWSITIIGYKGRNSDGKWGIWIAGTTKPITSYITSRWDNNYPNLTLLAAKNYANNRSNPIQGNQIEIDLTGAFDLLEEAEPATIFISYKRKESSAFALLLEDRLSQAGLSPFLDKQLKAGDDWHAELEGKIANLDYFLLILGQETLKSTITVKEIKWAIEHKKMIIPIWHNNFEFKSAEWPDLDTGIVQILGNTHTIRVIEENPLTYDTALRELLNRFGISG